MLNVVTSRCRKLMRVPFTTSLALHLTIAGDCEAAFAAEASMISTKKEVMTYQMIRLVID